ncbi:hypothetical protein [Thermocatellispora tengchongensis]|uniref:hypothetical protein n=1 Tax=Thermocatellispora tengchongensis TaxID=1073253 RepID=UPI003635D8A9
MARMRAALAAAGAAQSGGAAVTAALAGLCLGLATLIRIDGLRDVLPVVAYAGLLIALRRMPGLAGRAPIGDGRLGLPLLGGVTAGVALGFLAAQILARPYLAYLRGSVIPLLAICAAVLALTAAGAALAPRLARLAPSPPARLPELAAGLALLVMLAFAVRPLLQTVRRDPATPEDALTAEFVGAIQRANGLPADPTRLYSEQSLYWVIWYVGVPVALLAALAVVVLTRRLARGTGFGWLLPLGVIGWTTVTTLALPAITPDHPFASRRLVPVIIPGMVLLGVWGLRWLRDKARRMGYGAAPQRAVVLAGAALALAFPVYISAGTAFTPVERGEAAAVARLCAAIPPDASVLIVERVTGDRFTQLVRGVCGVPAARAAIPAATPGNPGDRVATTTERDGDEAPSAEVTRLIDRIRATGRRPVLLAAEAAQLTPYSARPRHVLHLSTRQDERTLVSPPDATWSLTTNVWLAAP